MSKDSSKVLVIDSDENVRESIKVHLKNSGFQFKILHNGEKIHDIFNEYNPDMVVLENKLHYGGGIEILKWIRSKSQIPIIIVSEEDSTFNKVLALDLGADDYIVKPFDIEELIARIKAIMRRSNYNDNLKKIIKFKDIKIDGDSYYVSYNGEKIKMPPKEFELLYYLAQNKNKVFTREQLLYKVWGYDYPGDSRTVDVHIKRLRSKIKNGDGWSIETVWGIGYKFEVK